MTRPNIEEDANRAEAELNAAEKAAGPEQRRKSHASANALIVAGFRQIAQGIRQNLEIVESGDALAVRAQVLATELGTKTTARPLGHAPWRALLATDLAAEEPTAFDLGSLLATAHDPQALAMTVCKIFNAGSPLVCSGPSGRKTTEQVAEILMATFDRDEPKRRQIEADAPIIRALAEAAELERERERELLRAKKWRHDADAKRQAENQERGAALDAVRTREELQRNAHERRAQEDAELAEFRAAQLSGDATAAYAARGI